MTSKFLKAVGLQIFGKSICTCVRVYILLKNRANGRSFIFIDLQHTVNQTITIGRKSAVPAAFPRFLNATFHCLDANVFALDLSYRRKNGNHELACILGGINAIFHADEVDPEILHDLQGRQHIGGIAAEPRQFEHQNVGNAIFS